MWRSNAKKEKMGESLNHKKLSIGGGSAKKKGKISPAGWEKPTRGETKGK